MKISVMVAQDLVEIYFINFDIYIIIISHEIVVYLSKKKKKKLNFIQIK